MAGEQAHLDGIEGLHRAKRWLELSTRVGRVWTVEDKQLADMLHLPWPHGTGKPFSFDLGGTFQGGRLADQTFLAEVKAYRWEEDLPEHWRHFVAKCYVAFLSRPARCDHLLWISWSPFQAQSWHRHRTVERVRAALLHRDNRARVFGESDEEKAAGKVDAEAIVAVSQRLWLVTLCDQQEDLVPTPEHRAMVEFALKMQEARSAS
jgi:hypothetical protein